MRVQDGGQLRLVGNGGGEITEIEDQYRDQPCAGHRPTGKNEESNIYSKVYYVIGK